MLASLSDAEQEAFARTFAEEGMVRIPHVIGDEDALALHAMLRQRDDWMQIFNSGERLFEVSRQGRAEIPAEKQNEIDLALYAAARNGFQYRFETIRVPDSRSEREASADSLCKIAQTLSTQPVLDILRRITGSPEVQYADAQGTAYSPGDFLTGHDDAVVGKNRRAAYVLSLTPTWRLEWGGLLMMHGKGDEPAQAYMPEMNLLTLFRVGQLHSVSEVTRAAAYRRYSVTGWLRAESQPE